MALVVTSLEGHILHFVGPAPRTELQLLNESDVRDRLREANIGIVADALYCFNLIATNESDYIRHAWTVGPSALRMSGEIAHDETGAASAKDVADARSILSST